MELNIFFEPVAGRSYATSNMSLAPRGRGGRGRGRRPEGEGGDGRGGGRGRRGEDDGGRGRRGQGKIPQNSEKESSTGDSQTPRTEVPEVEETTPTRPKFIPGSEKEEPTPKNNRVRQQTKLPQNKQQQQKKTTESPIAEPPAETSSDNDTPVPAVAPTSPRDDPEVPPNEDPEEISPIVDEINDLGDATICDGASDEGTLTADGNTDVIPEKPSDDDAKKTSENDSPDDLENNIDSTTATEDVPAVVDKKNNKAEKNNKNNKSINAEIIEKKTPKNAKSPINESTSEITENNLENSGIHENCTVPPNKDTESKAQQIVPPNPYTFPLTIPLPPEIIAPGEKTFIEIDSVFYLKISVPQPESNSEEIQIPEWYTSLKKDFDIAKTPLTKAQLRKKEMREKKFTSQKAEKTNGSLVFVMDIPEFLTEEKKDKKDKKKKNKKRNKNKVGGDDGKEN